MTVNIRQPRVAGSFYESSASSCRHHAEKLLKEAVVGENLPSPLYGGLVPHAGWTYSGRLAARTLKSLAADRPLETVILLGADHTGAAARGEIFDSGVWRTPIGEAQIDEELAAKLLAAESMMRANPHAHEFEHSIEVQVPLILTLCPDARIVPITVPPSAAAARIGKVIGRVLAESQSNAHVVGSTDLTHHGGRFGAPGGHGKEGEEWSSANDQRMLELIQKMAAEEIVPEADVHRNACGAGAIAATIAACHKLGATAGCCIEYTNSYRVIREMYPNEQDDTTVGYASVVFG